MLIGLSGKRGAGKDTVAAALVEHHGYTRVAFADALKDMLYAQNPLVELDDHYAHHRLADLVDRWGWDEVKSHADVRKLLQRSGQWMFKHDKMFWVKAASRGINYSQNVVITDLRFDHERDWLVDDGGKVVRIHRTDHIVTDPDPSEVQADAWDYDLVICNTPGLTTPEMLADEIVRWKR